LLVESATSGAVDKSATLGQTYEYRAQRILRATIDGNTVELPGELSSPVRIETKDVFPPAVPTDLVAVATATDAATGAPASIDLSWQPSADNNLAGYEVYRREDMTPWRRISGEQPVVGPAFRDAQVVPGHTYRYAVSAVSQSGHESTRSDEAQETVPNP
jgi:fibronectin type 3 domain-containing protein